MQLLNHKIIRGKIRGFTACTPAFSLLETIIAVADSAKAGVENSLHLLIRALSVFKTDSNERKEICRMVKSISWGWPAASPKMHGENTDALQGIQTGKPKIELFAPWFFEGKARSERTN